MQRAIWGWFTLWVLAMALSWMLGAIIGGFVRGLGSPTTSALGLDLVGIAAGMVASTILSVAGQSFLMQHKWKIGLHWFKWSVLGIGLGLFAFLIVGGLAFLLFAFGIAAMVSGSDSDSGSWAAGIMGAFALFVAVMIGWAGLGVTVSIFQARLLRERVQNSHSWIRTTALSWVGGVPLTLLVLWLAQPLLFMIYHHQLTSTGYTGGFTVDLVTLNGVYGAIIGIGTARAMKRFMTESATTSSTAVAQGAEI